MLDGDAVQVQEQEHERRNEAYALVPIDEGVIGNDVEQIGRGHREQPTWVNSPPNEARG